MYKGKKKDKVVLVTKEMLRKLRGKNIKTKGKDENLLQETYSSKCLKCQSDKNITLSETT